MCARRYTHFSVKVPVSASVLLLLPSHFQVHDLEFAQIELQVVEGLKTGNESLKKMHQVKINSMRKKLANNRDNYFQITGFGFSSLPNRKFYFQMLSIEDVEKIMEETEEGIEYQKVGHFSCQTLQQFHRS